MGGNGFRRSIRDPLTATPRPTTQNPSPIRQRNQRDNRSIAPIAPSRFLEPAARALDVALQRDRELREPRRNAPAAVPERLGETGQPQVREVARRVARQRIQMPRDFAGRNAVEIVFGQHQQGLQRTLLGCVEVLLVSHGLAVPSSVWGRRACRAQHGIPDFPSVESLFAWTACAAMYS
jgi:hypothetical protein